MAVTFIPSGTGPFGRGIEITASIFIEQAIYFLLVQREVIMGGRILRYFWFGDQADWTGNGTRRPFRLPGFRREMHGPVIESLSKQSSFANHVQWTPHKLHQLNEHGVFIH
jgi:hypothetical protein